ncbi:MAG: VWA domain-containing protein [Acidimicrobiales bacterium]
MTLEADFRTAAERVADPDKAVPIRMAKRFVDLLREQGVNIPVGSTINYLDALAILGLGDSDAVYWAGRATLITKPNDIGVYDELFGTYWLGVAPVEVAVAEPDVVTLAFDDDVPDEGDEGSEEGETITVRYSASEILSAKDFAEYTDEELAEALELMSRMHLVGETRPARRLVTTRRRGVRPDVRRTVREALRSGGEPVRWHHFDRSDRPRRLVLLLDVSGSMETYARALIRFVHVAVVGRRRVEAFALGTRLTRLTRELSSRDPDQALTAAADAVEDWSGGTRLGDALRAFNDEWGQRGMARGAVVVILSDGWDRGAPEIMDEQMARLARCAHRIIWVNPLKATPGYAPVAQGMAAALPHVDDFIEGHSMNSLAELARVIERTDHGAGR